MKTCTKCKEPKELSEFRDHAAYRDGKVSWCISCQLAAVREWKLNNKQKQKTYDRQWKRIKKYGVTDDLYLQMLASQNGVCKICKNLPDDSPKGLLYVDHCHLTGKVRGLLCDHCNNLLGRAKDSVEVLKSAIEYLENQC